MAGRTFVLVHGAWHGGWCWKRVADRLRAQGHTVYAPTLTGVADRFHAATPDTGLDTQIDDIVHLIKWEELSDVVLVGHSYGGLVISGVAEKAEHAISSIVYLDAFVPENGQALVDMTGSASAEKIRKAAQDGETTVSPIPSHVFKVNEADSGWIDKMCTPHPIRCFIDPVALTGARERLPRRTYILASVYGGATFVPTHARLKNDPAWQTYEIPCGHDVMVDMPDRLTEVLLEVA